MDYRQHITAEKVFAREMLPESKRRRKRLIHRVFKPYKKVKSDDLERKERDYESKKVETKEKYTNNDDQVDTSYYSYDTDDAYLVETWVE